MEKGRRDRRASEISEGDSTAVKCAGTDGQLSKMLHTVLCPSSVTTRLGTGSRRFIQKVNQMALVKTKCLTCRIGQEFSQTSSLLGGSEGQWLCKKSPQQTQGLLGMDYVSRVWGWKKKLGSQDQGIWRTRNNSKSGSLESPIEASWWEMAVWHSYGPEKDSSQTGWGAQTIQGSGEKQLLS